MGRNPRKIYGILGVALLIISIPSALYFAIWWGLVKPIMTIAEAIDTDTLTASLVGWELIKFFLREFMAVVAIYVCWIGAFALMRKS